MGLTTLIIAKTLYTNSLSSIETNKSVLSQLLLSLP